MFLRERIHCHGRPLKRVRRAEFHRANISRGRHDQTRGIRLKSNLNYQTISVFERVFLSVSCPLILFRFQSNLVSELERAIFLKIKSKIPDFEREKSKDCAEVCLEYVAPVKYAALSLRGISRGRHKQTRRLNLKSNI